MSGPTFPGDAVLLFASVIVPVFVLGAYCALLARYVDDETEFPDWFRRGPHQ